MGDSRISILARHASRLKIDRQKLKLTKLNTQSTMSPFQVTIAMVVMMTFTLLLGNVAGQGTASVVISASAKSSSSSMAMGSPEGVSALTTGSAVTMADGPGSTATASTTSNANANTPTGEAASRTTANSESSNPGAGDSDLLPSVTSTSATFQAFAQSVGDTNAFAQAGGFPPSGALYGGAAATAEAARSRTIGDASSASGPFFGGAPSMTFINTFTDVDFGEDAISMALAEAFGFANAEGCYGLGC